MALAVILQGRKKICDSIANSRIVPFLKERVIRRLNMTAKMLKVVCLSAQANHNSVYAKPMKTH